jgi:hypothetical protein
MGWEKHDCLMKAIVVKLRYDQNTKPAGKCGTLGKILIFKKIKPDAVLFLPLNTKDSRRLLSISKAWRESIQEFLDTLPSRAAGRDKPLTSSTRHQIT